MAKCGLPADRRDIQAIVQNYMRTVANDLPINRDWLHGFEKRYPDLPSRKSKILTAAQQKDFHQK